jgi:dolichyl-phosphate beta-glucosyltransferase
VRRGVLYASSRADLVGYWDADLATPLDAIPVLVSVLERHDATLVMGSRVKIAGHEIIRSAWRHYLGRVFATLASAVIGLGFYDTQCGAKVFRKEIVEPCFTQPFLSRWCFDIEMLLRLIRFGGIMDINSVNSRLIEVPLPRWTDTGDTRLGVTDIFRMGLDLGRIACAYRL